MNFIAVEGCNIQVPLNESGISGGFIQIQTPPQQNAQIKNAQGVMKKIYAGDIVVSISGATMGAYSQSSPATVTIKPQIAKKTKVNGEFVLVEGDEGKTDTAIPFANSSSSTTAVIPLKIISAGQSKVRCE